MIQGNEFSSNAKIIEFIKTFKAYKKAPSDFDARLSAAFKKLADIPGSLIERTSAGVYRLRRTMDDGELRTLDAYATFFSGSDGRTKAFAGGKVRHSLKKKTVRSIYVAICWSW